MILHPVDPAWQARFDFLGATPIVVEPSQGQLSSDAGLLPIRQFDDRIGLTRAFADAIADGRDAGRVDHSLLEMVRARVFGIVAGYEDQNDHDALRYDPVFQMVAGRRPDAAPLASQPTHSRFENAATAGDLKRLAETFVASFLDSFAEPPRRLTFDIDAVDDPCHGQQQLAFFHGYDDQWQYLPLLVSNEETGQFVTLSLRQGNAHAALGAEDDLEFLVTRVRQRFPDVEIHVRGDCGFGLPKMYETCERLGVRYTFGLTANAVLQRKSEDLLAEAKRRWEETGEPQRLFDVFGYRAKGWTEERTVVVKAECHAAGTNRRFVVTDRSGATVLPEGCYDEYVQRGEAENRNKEIKTDLAMDRLSDHRFKANFLRLYLHAAAHNLLARLRTFVALPPLPSPEPDVPAEALAGATRRAQQRRGRVRDPLGRAQPATWRLMLVKVAAEVIVSARRVVVRLAANWPYLHLYERIAAALRAPPAFASAPA